jgi:hypothetical protein
MPDYHSQASRKYADQGLLQEVFPNDVAVENHAARIARYPHDKAITSHATRSVMAVPLQVALTRPVIAKEIPGFLPGLLRSLLLFRGHGRFLLVFLLTSSFFRHGFRSK